MIPYLLACANRFDLPERFYEQKIFGEPDSNGMAQMTILSISHTSGKWGIGVQNGKGKKIRSKTGGFYAEKNSFQETSNLFFSLSDVDFLFAMQSCSDYIRLMKEIIGVQQGEIHKNLTEFKKRQEIYQESHKSKHQNDAHQVKALSDVRLSNDSKEPYFWALIQDKKCVLYLKDGNVPIKKDQTYSVKLRVNGKKKLCFFFMVEKKSVQIFLTKKR